MLSSFCCPLHILTFTFSTPITASKGISSRADQPVEDTWEKVILSVPVSLPPQTLLLQTLTEHRIVVFLASSLSFFLQTQTASAVLPQPWHLEVRSRHQGDPHQHKSVSSMGKEAWRGNTVISSALCCPQSCDVALLPGVFLCKTSEQQQLS